MNRHQVLTGACNSGDQCYAVGSVEGIHFTAYAAGCDIVILASDFQRVQIIPGVTHGNVKVSCIDCSTDTGKIAASYQNKVYIFEPTPLLHHESTHVVQSDGEDEEEDTDDSSSDDSSSCSCFSWQDYPIFGDHDQKLDYQWYQTAMFEASCFINCITWNMEGSKLLTAGEVMQIWQYHRENGDSHGGVQFSVGEEDNHPHHNSNTHTMNNTHLSPDTTDTSWECIWSQKPATPVYHLKFSPDGLLFASAGKADRLVKIWHEDRKIQLPLSRTDSVVSPKKDVHHYSFVYIAHPRAVTGFSWRQTSKYMPRGSVANMLVTSCADNVCRLWCETILPDDGLVDLEQFDQTTTADRKFHTHRHKKRFMQRLKTISQPDKSPSDSSDLDSDQPTPEDQRHAIHKRRKHHKFGPETVMSMPNLAGMNSTASIHDFHKFALHNNGMAPPLHFHLAVSINPETDIPLLPVVGSKGEVQHNFQLHWLNNKELQFTMEAEVILQELHRSSMVPHQDHDEATDSDGLNDHQYHLENEEHETDSHPKKKKRLFKKKHKGRKSPKESTKGLGSHTGSQSSISSDQGDHVSEGASSGGMSPEVPGSVIDALDRKIEALLKEWHQSADMLFSIHPVDGSFLVWLVDWMDEYNPYCFRQAQVSFSSRLPHAFPVPDARTMASNLLMYCNYSKMDIKSAMRISENKFSPSNSAAPTKIQTQPAPATGKCFPGQNDNMLIPNVLLISKHFNGSLNQWQISFADNSQFSTVVSVAHASRACGHRFRTNSAACHPVLPLLLTTSHHNVPNPTTPNKNNGDQNHHDNQDNLEKENVDSGIHVKDSLVGGVEFCSELILWRVDPVGPLSKSGGIVELARINSPQLSAFDNVAWVPTLLPSSTLGSYSNSPSALFVASNGDSLMMYQAVIDARTLLMEMGAQKRELHKGMSFSSNTSSGYSQETPHAASELFNIVSLQSSARPGCIIEMEAIANAKQDWQQTQLLHVFQEQLVTGKLGNNPNGMEAIVDLRDSGTFSENFYLVVLERNKDKGSTIHMWKINIASQTGFPDGNRGRHYVPDSSFVEEDGSDSDSAAGSPIISQPKTTAVVRLTFSTTKVCSQSLDLPEGVSVVSASVSAGHLSSSSIYPACLSPYLLATACSDGETRFWRCNMVSVDSETAEGCDLMTCSTMSYELAVKEEDGVQRPTVSTVMRDEVLDTALSWTEWHMMGQTESSSLRVRGQPISVSCAYSGRVAVAYRLGGVRSAPDNDNKYVNLYVAVYECESTGGSEWTLEDTIELKNISIPDPQAEIDLNCIFTPETPSLSPSHYNEESPASLSPSSSLVGMSRTRSVPSLSTIFTVRKCIAEHGNKTGMLQQKHLVQLDWVSTEDGSHILTVGVGSRILMYSQVANDIVQSSKRVVDSSQPNDKSSQSFALSMKDASHRRSVFQKSKSMVIDDHQEEIKWMKLRSIELTTADALPPLPMHLSWVRGGILVVGMDNEMHVYSQWRGAGTNDVLPVEGTDSRSFEDAGLSMNISNLKPQQHFKPSYSVPSFKHLNSLSLKKEKLLGSETNLMRFSLSKDKSESSTSLSAIHEFGLFEAARQANPVLPQYHPKKLMELLNFGKIRRVKAILSHLVRYVAGGDIYHTESADEYDKDDLRWMPNRPRGISVSGASPGDVPQLKEEPQLDYKEISSIPPLPMYALLAADEDNTVAKADTITSGGQVGTSVVQDYGDLFDSKVGVEDDLDINIGPSSADSRSSRTRLQSTTTAARQNPYYFGPEYSAALTGHLTHTQLPGLSSLDQMYLLAVADTVANTKMDFADHMESNKPDNSTSENSVYEGNAAEAMDDCGLRFILSMRHHIYLLRTLQPRQRIVLQQQGLKSFNLVWGFHSEATEELLSYIPSMQRGEPTWEELKQFGAGWWINNINILKRCMEKVAKAAFQNKKDPIDAAIFYLAMKKKNVLWGLYRSIDDKKMMQFFRNDFTQDRWRKAALKNAFDLLGRQRFTHAAAFFLLAGALNDAVEVCLDKLGDIQLALVVCRLYSGEDMMPDSVKKILYTYILGCDSDGCNCDNTKIHPDPFLRSMSLWSLKDYRGSLNTLLHTSSHRRTETDSIELEGHNAMPSVFNFYNYLRTHPLLVRQRIAATGQTKKKQSIIPGFTRQQTVVLDDSSVFVDKVTPIERKLFFTTAHTHFMNGCPLLALEVLSKLPPVIEDKKSPEIPMETKISSKDSCISTGTLEQFDNNASEKPLVNGINDTTEGFDWGAPVSTVKETADSMDWGAPIVKFDDDDDGPNFKISSEEDEDSDDSDSCANKTDHKAKLEKLPTIVIEEPSPLEQSSEDVLPGKPVEKTKDKGQQVDIFAQQYKFIACLKVLMEEMQTLATGFEVDGGQLRFQLYIWLEREVEVLQYLCNYGYMGEIRQEDIGANKEAINGYDDDEALLEVHNTFSHSMSMRADTSYKPTLHEVILAEKMDFEAKLERMSRRKLWLRANQQLLRTLASYCVLQGSGGGGLASVEMELLLLLQELQQEKPQQQLLSPLPFPTTLPLLSASIASSKTVVADPIQHIQCMTQDLLHSIVELTSPPGLGVNMNTVLVMQNLSVALSSCIYQCLCDCDSFVVSLNETQGTSMDGFMAHNFNSSQAGHLMAGVQRYRRKSSTGDNMINTPPSKWPGVTSLRVLLAREKDDASPKLNILCCESLIAVYVSLLVNALAMYDCNMLYRLVSHRFEHQMWSALFGGGVKTALKVVNNPNPISIKPGDDLSNSRLKLHRMVMGSGTGAKEKTTFRETFVPPELSMISFFMTKPFNTASEKEFHYDSEESLSDEEEPFDDDEDDYLRPKSLPLASVQQYTDPTSYSWALIRFCIVKVVLHNLQVFLPQIGIEILELPICSTLMHTVLKTLEQWMEVLQGKLELFAGPPDDFIAGLQLDVVAGVPQSKYQVLLQPQNSPFSDDHMSLPIKRLWFHLLKQNILKDVFIRYIYRKKKIPQMEESMSQSDIQDGNVRMRDPMKIIHKEQDIITAFALNQANTNFLVLSTQKEVVELDIGQLLSPPAWLEDENEMDIEYIKNPNPTDGTNTDFFVVQAPSDGQQTQSEMTSGMSSPQTGASTPTHPGSGVFQQTGRGTNVGKGIHIPGITNPQFSQHVLDRSRRLLRLLLRRPVSGVRRIGSHPHLPHYLTGGSDGSVRLYEWGHVQPLAMLRQPGVFPKVTKVLFSSQGNKCCVSDTEGDICLWQVGLGSNFNKPIMSLKCHNKTTSDFAFVGSSSLIATAGHSSENRNVCLWDTLLPVRSACVHAFNCHEHGCPAIVYAPHHQLLISGGRKGEICIFDIRQRQIRHTFQAHEAAVRCLAMDPEEEYFITGSAEGEIKVWGLDVHQLIVGFPGEHSKNTFFRNMGSASGVTQISIGATHHMFSCGVDGSMKFRALPERENIVRYWSAT